MLSEKLAFTQCKIQHVKSNILKSSAILYSSELKSIILFHDSLELPNFKDDDEVEEWFSDLTGVNKNKWNYILIIMYIYCIIYNSVHFNQFLKIKETL